MIQKMSDQGKIKFTEPETQLPPVEKKAEKVRAEFVNKPAQKLNNSDSVASRFGNAILSAGGGIVKDIGGPNKFIGSETGNSIWNTDNISKIAETPSNKEKTDKEKETIQEVRKTIRKQALDNLTEALQSTDTRKANSVSNLSSYAGSNYKDLSGNLSIFDTEKFDNMPEKTHGEKVAEESRKIKEKDYIKSGSNKLKSSLLNNIFEK